MTNIYFKSIIQLKMVIYMAYISERMDDNKIQFLANEMTRTYMANKTSLSSDDFMKEYYRFYNSAQSFIAEE